MKSALTHTQIEDLLLYCGADKLQMWKGNKIQFCCPIHGESNPSCGIDSDFSPPDEPTEHYQVFHCFSCGESGTIPTFVKKSLPDQFKTYKKVYQFLKDRYEVSFQYHYDPETKTIKRYEDQYDIPEETRHILPMSTLAPFRSGKETYQYFFDRGFDKADMREFKIGRDLQSQTITMPVFWEDGQLAGVIGRYIDPARRKNARFKIYSFPKGSLLFPLDKFEANGTVILVEAIFDVIMLRRWGFFNTLATMGDGFSRQQADLVLERCNKVIPLFDNDAGGDVARKLVEKRLKGKCLISYPSYYPEYGKDPCEWGETETVKVIQSAGRKKNIPRL